MGNSVGIVFIVCVITFMSTASINPIVDSSLNEIARILNSKESSFSTYMRSYFNAEALEIESESAFVEDLDGNGRPEEIFLTSDKIIIKSCSTAVVLDSRNGLEIPTCVAVADIDRDGINELIAVSHNSSSTASLPSGIKDKILIYELPINNSSLPSIVINIQSFDEGGKYAKTESIVFGNFSSDGYDIAVNVYVPNDNGRIQIFDGPIIFPENPSQVIRTSKGSKFLKINDDNGDGLNDLYVLCVDDSRIEVFYKMQNFISSTASKRYTTQASPITYSIKNNNIYIISSLLLRIYRNLQLYGDFSIGGLWIISEDFNRDGNIELAVAQKFFDTYRIAYYDTSPRYISATYINTTIKSLSFKADKLYVCGSSTIILKFLNFDRLPAVAHQEFISLDDAIGIKIYEGKYYLWNNSELNVLYKTTKYVYPYFGIKEVLAFRDLICMYDGEKLIILNSTTNTTSEVFLGSVSTHVCKIEYDKYELAVSTSIYAVILVDVDELTMESIYSLPAHRICSEKTKICGINSNELWILDIKNYTILTYSISNMRGISVSNRFLAVFNETSIHLFELTEGGITLEKELYVQNLLNAMLGDFCDEGNLDLILLLPSEIQILELSDFSLKRKYYSLSPLINISLGNLNFNGRLCISTLSTKNNFSIVQSWEYENLRPVAIIDARDVIYENENVVLSGNGSYDQYSDLNSLNFTWYYLNNTSWEFISHNKYIIFTPQSQGTHSFKLEVRDDEGLSNSTTKTITVLDLVPYVDFYFIPSNISEGLAVEFYENCTSFDPIINYTWKIENKTYYGKRIRHKFESNGSYEVFLEVIDLDGSYNYTKKVIFVEDSKPIIFNVEYSPLTPVEGKEIIFKCEIKSYDPIRDVIWRFRDADELRGSTVTYKFINDGIYTVRVKVIDIDFSEAEAEFFVRVLDTIPSVEIESQNNRYYEDDIFTLTAIINSYDAIKNILWDLDYNGEFNPDLSGNNITCSFSRSGIHTIAVKVVDSDNSFTITTKEIFIENVPPVAEFVVSFQIENHLRFDASVTRDTKSDYPLLNYTWSFGDGSIGYGRIVEHKYRSPGRYYVSLRVVDDDGAESSTGMYIYVSFYDNRIIFYTFPMFVILLFLIAILLVRQTTVEDVYIIHRNGILLSHYSSKLKQIDEDTLSAMLVAILEFIKTAYKDEKDTLKSLNLGGKRILVDKYRDIFLVVSLRRGFEFILKKKIRKTLEKVWENYGEVLKEWDGDFEKIRGIGDIVKKMWKI